MKTIAITGANRGIGFATARELAGAGHRILLLCRSESRGREAIRSLPGPPEEDRHHLVVMDLASFDSVRTGAQNILGLGYPLQALVNNAATLPAERRLSQDGFELQLAVTHLGHFLLTNLLLPALKPVQEKSRVITVSSNAHFGPPFNFADPNFVSRKYARRQAYQQSKLANVLFIMALARRVQKLGIEAVALHPGVYDTQILRDFLGHASGTGVFARAISTKLDRSGPILARLAVDRRTEQLGGTYLNKARVSEASGAARDVDAQERLWRWSTEVTGLLQHLS